MDEEVLVGFWLETGGLGGRGVEEDVSADEDALAAAAVVTGGSDGGALTVVGLCIAAEDDAGFGFSWWSPEVEGEGSDELGNGFDDRGELRELRLLDGIVGMEAKVGCLVGVGNSFESLDGDDLCRAGLELLRPGFEVFGEGGRGEQEEGS